MAEPVDDVIAVMVPAAAVPSREAGVGAELNHAEGKGRPGIGVPVAARADEGIYERRWVSGPAGSGRGGWRGCPCFKNIGRRNREHDKSCHRSENLDSHTAPFSLW